MLLQDAPPDTSGYMIAGYAIFFAISIIYLFSLAIRRRNLEQDLRTLEEIEGRKPLRSPVRAAASSARSGRKSQPEEESHPVTMVAGSRSPL